MWGRVIEMMTAVWLVFGPFIFRAESTESLILIDTLVGLLIVLCAALSYWHPTRYAHLLILGIAIGLIVWGRFSVSPPPPIHQNHIAVGLFLLMIALIPNESSRPPHAWRRVPD